MIFQYAPTYFVIFLFWQAIVLYFFLRIWPWRKPSPHSLWLRGLYISWVVLSGPWSSFPA